MADDKSGRSRRDWLRTISGGGFFGAVGKAIAPLPREPRIRSSNPPSEKPIIPAGKEAEVLALLGPLATESVDGYRFDEAVVGPERIDFSWSGPGGSVRISLVALAAVDAGVVHAYTRSFRLLTDGGAPAEVRFAIAERVAAEVLERDHGQLWVKADAAPRSDGGA